jgi:hypothetical protein
MSLFLLGFKEKIDNNASKKVFCACIQCKLLPTQNFVIMYFFVACSLLHFKTLMLQERHCGDDRFFWNVAKICFVIFIFFVIGGS